MIKLIAADLDGTLLNDQKQLGPDFWEVEKKLRAKGIYFAMASGRQYYTLMETFEPIKDHIIFIAENGTYVIYKGEVLHLNAMNMASAKQFIEIGRKIKDAYIIACGKSAAYVESPNEAFLKEVRTYYKRYQIVDDLTQVDDDILKVTMCDFDDASVNSYPYFKSLESCYTVAVSGKIWLDITLGTANKGTAIEKIQEKMGISPDETLAFGDFFNDIEMLQAAKYSYAMKNAHPDIIKAAKYVTEFDNNHNGVLEVIKKLCLSD
jgi:Cof subfamily protein (haloacid dehalogenase superfamily)